MFRSRVVAHQKPSSLRSISWILGIGYGIRLILLFNSRMSLIKRMVLSFLGIMNNPKAHSESFTFLRTPILHRRSSSTLRVVSKAFGTANGLEWYGVTPSLSVMWYGLHFHLPNVPSNNVLYFCMRWRNCIHCFAKMHSWGHSLKQKSQNDEEGKSFGCLWP